MSSNLVVNHQHCWICGKAVPPSEAEGPKVCSEACQGKLNQQNKKRKTLMYFLYGAMGLTLVLLLVGGRV